MQVRDGGYIEELLQTSFKSKLHS